MSKMYQYLILLSCFVINISELSGQRKLFDVNAISVKKKALHGNILFKYQGDIQLSGSFDHGKKEGGWIRFYENRSVWIKGSYKQDELHGKWEYFGREGNLHAEMYYNEGIPVGTWKSYYLNGLPLAVIQFDSTGFSKEAILYNQLRKVILYEKQWLEGKDTIKVSSYYKEDYEISEFTEYKNSERNGRLIRYHDKGLIWESEIYEEGKLVDVLEMNTDRGKSLLKGNFRKGNGELKRYHKTGGLYAVEHYKNGQLHGEVVYYNNGKTAGKGQYNQGIPYGEWVVYNKYHSVRAYLNYDTLNQQVGVKRFTTANHNETVEGNFKYGVKEGEWKQYDLYGFLRSKMDFLNGELHGNYEVWNEKVLKVKGRHVNNEAVGKWEYFNAYGKKYFEEEYLSLPKRFWGWRKKPLDRFDFRVSKWNNIQFENKTYRNVDGIELLLCWLSGLPGIELLADKLDVNWMDGVQKVGIERESNKHLSPYFRPPVFPSGSTLEKAYFQEFSIKNKDAIGMKGNWGGTELMIKISPMGFFENFVVVKSIGKERDKLAEEYILSMPVWEPAFYHGFPVSTVIVKRFFISKEGG